MSSSREIITLQLGNYANYVGTHWWNIQESTFSYEPGAEPSEINHDVLFREGKNLKGQTTYTPRLVLVDLNGSLRHMSQEGELYTDEDTTLLASTTEEKTIADTLDWKSSNVDVIRSEKIEKPQFLKDLETAGEDKPKEYKFVETVQSWTDFMYSRYHPRSINLIKEYKYTEVDNEFDTFTNGCDLWKNGSFVDDFYDKIRLYIEESDNCQGFQTIFDCTDGFSGLTIKCLESLIDDYGKTILAVPLISPKVKIFKNADEAMTTSIRVVNLAMTYTSLIDHSSLFLPLSTMARGWRDIDTERQFPNIQYQDDNYYHTSAIIATYLDTISLKYRLQSPNFESYLSGFCSDLNDYGKKLVAGALALPIKINANEDLIDCLDRINGQIFTQLSPNSDVGTDHIVQCVCVRGISKNKLKRPLKSAQHQMKMAAYKCDSVSEMFQLYFQCNNYASKSHVAAIQSPLPIRTPYPMEIFNNRINFQGFISDTEREAGQNVISSPVLASVQTSRNLANTLESLHREANKIKIAKLCRFKETGLETDEYAEILNRLLDFKDLYEDHFDL